MTILPLLNQFIVPTFVSVYALISAFFPVGATHTKGHVATHVGEKKVLAIAEPTPTTIVAETEKKQPQYVHPLQIDNTKNTDTETSLTSSPSQEKPSTTSSSHVSPTPTAYPIISQIVTAKTTLSASGKTIHVTMQYPSLGGNITGTLSGDCNGTISGVYDGPSSQTLSGKGNATCPVGFISVPVEIQYSGKLTSDTNAQINYTVNAVGKTESGSANLSLGN